MQKSTSLEYNPASGVEQAATGLRAHLRGSKKARTSAVKNDVYIYKQSWRWEFGLSLHPQTPNLQADGDRAVARVRAHLVHLPFLSLSLSLSLSLALSPSLSLSSDGAGGGNFASVSIPKPQTSNAKRASRRRQGCGLGSCSSNMQTLIFYQLGFDQKHYTFTSILKMKSLCEVDFLD